MGEVPTGRSWIGFLLVKDAAFPGWLAKHCQIRDPLLSELPGASTPCPVSAPSLIFFMVDVMTQARVGLALDPLRSAICVTGCPSLSHRNVLDVSGVVGPRETMTCDAPP